MMSSPPSPERAFLKWLNQPGVRPYLLAALLTLGISQQQLDIFGLISGSDHISSQLFSHITSPFYGGEQHKGRDNILVVLYDKAYFEANRKKRSNPDEKTVTIEPYKPDWPLPPRKHRRLIEKIAQGNPSAIFLDVYFTIENDQRAMEVSKLYRELQDIDCQDKLTPEQCNENQQAPVFVASVLRDINPTALGTSPPRKALAEINVAEHLYRLKECEQRDSQQNCISETQHTAAYHLYKQWCDRQNKLKADSCQPIVDTGPGPLMYLQWGYAPSAEMMQLLASANDTSIDCQKETQGFSTIIASSKMAINGLLGKQPSLCSYHNTVSAALVEKLDYEQLQAMFKNKAVLIGATDYPLPDQVRSYVHGQLPGTYWHATALDNLIENPNDFLHKRPDAENKPIETRTVILLLFVMAAFAHANGLSKIRCKTLPEDENQHLTSIQVCTSIIALCLLAMAVIIVWIDQGYAPENWIATAGLLTTLCSVNIIAIHRLNVQLAIYFTHLTRKILRTFIKTSIGIKKNIDINNSIGKNINRKAHQSIRWPKACLQPQTLARYCRVLYFVVIGFFLTITFILLMDIAFFAPIIYFSTQTTGPIELIAFLLLYTGFVVFIFSVWLRKTRQLNSHFPSRIEKPEKQYPEQLMLLTTITQKK